MLTKRDVLFIAIIGAAVGLLVQPILANQITSIEKAVPLSVGAIRGIAFLIFLIGAPAALFIASLIAKKIPVIYQFAKFASVGVLNSFVDLGVFNAETLFYGGVPQSQVIYAFFKAISFLSGTTNSFFWNKYWTFGSSEKADSGQVLKFYGIAIAGGFINVGIATFVKSQQPASIPIAVWGNLIAPIVGILCVFMWNFLGYKFIVFKKKDEVAV